MATVRQIYLTNKQHLETLERFRDAIAKGLKLHFFNDETIGDKDSQATWGLCSRKKIMWPDPETHMWPNDPRDQNSDEIYGIKYLGGDQRCPMDKREGESAWGCFYHCRIFQGPRPTREQAVQLYDLSIERVKNARSSDQGKVGKL